MKDQTPTNLLLISQPNSPGQIAIPGVKQETDALNNMMLSKGINTLLLKDGMATTTQVKREMAAHNWVHFACHAIQDPHDSLKSGMHLHDGRLELLEIIKQKIENTDHAFLSACQTSTGDKKLSEEVVHLAAGMLAAGYQGVVATMWSIQDKHAPDIAMDFYNHLLERASYTKEKSQLDSTGAAGALDHAVSKIRQRLGDTEEALLTWVPYVHFGI
jgi:CHAT domain-containing protein